MNLLKGDEPSSHVEEVDEITTSLDAVDLKAGDEDDDEDNKIEEV